MAHGEAPDADMERRAEVARRLKAARWLAGGTRPKAKAPYYDVQALTPEALAERAPLPENKITANRIGTIERLEHYTPPMELQQIARALEMPDDWFSAPVAAITGATRRDLEETLRLLQGLLAGAGIVPQLPREEPPPGAPAR